MTIVGWADDRVGPCARATLAGIALGTGVFVVACCPVLLGRARAGAAARVANSVVALVDCRACHGILSGTDTAQANIGLRAKIPIIARRGIRHVRVVAHACRRIARPDAVALIRRIAPRVTIRVGGADFVLAGIAPRAGVAVGAHGSVVVLGIGTIDRARATEALVDLLGDLLAGVAPGVEIVYAAHVVIATAGFGAATVGRVAIQVGAAPGAVALLPGFVGAECAALVGRGIPPVLHAGVGGWCGHANVVGLEGCAHAANANRAAGARAIRLRE